MVFKDMVLKGIVLAGGRSQRMGKDKALLKRDKEETMLNFSRRRLLEAGCESVIVSGGAHSDVDDIYTNKGPLGGIYSVVMKDTVMKDTAMSDVVMEDTIRKNTKTHYLIIPVDMPCLDQKVFQPLVAEISEIDAVHFSYQYFPLLLIVSSTVKETLQHCVMQGGAHLSIHYFLSCCRIKTLECDSPESLLNTNTPEEWQVFLNTKA